MKVRDRYSIDKNVKSRQSVMYASNAMVDILNNADKNVIVVSSSVKDRNVRSSIIYNIALEISKLDKKVALMNVDFSNSLNEEDEIDSNGSLYKRTTVNPTIKEFRILLDELKNKYDIVIVNIPPVRIFSNALQYAKICENIILVERYLYTRYNAFEETLDYLKQSSVNISGIITYR